MMNTFDMTKNAEQNKKQYATTELISNQIILPKNFKKPAHIYSMLRERHAKSPLFLHRTLNYMADRMRRNKTEKRRDFKVSRLLIMCIKRMLSESSDACIKIDLLGFFVNLSSSNRLTDSKLTCVTVTLFKIIKSGSNGYKHEVEEVLKFNTQVTINPYGNAGPLGGICIPFKTLKSIDQQNVSYRLLFSIETSRQTYDDKLMVFNLRTLSRIYKGEFNFCDKTCSVIAEGDYEVRMKETSMSEKHTLNGVHENMWFNGFKMNSRLKFHVSWLPTALNQDVSNQTTIINCKNFIPLKLEDINNNLAAKNEPINVKVTYNFIKRSKRRFTEHTLNAYKMICLWCNLNCLHMNALLKHLELCHERFLYKEHNARINISFNNSYNAAVEFAKASKCAHPMHLTSSTKLLFYRKREYNIRHEELNVKSKVIRKRQYYHSTTLLEIHPNELSFDSEEEHSIEFAEKKMFNTIEKRNFIARKGEKTLMKLWNMHMMKQRLVGQVHLQNICEKFVENFGLEILRQNLYNAFILHLHKLFDENLLSAESVWSFIRKVSELMGIQQTTTQTQTIPANVNLTYKPNNENLPHSNTKSSFEKTSIKKESVPASVRRNPARKAAMANKLIPKSEPKTLLTHHKTKSSLNTTTFKKVPRDLKPIRRSARLLALANCE